MRPLLILALVLVGCGAPIPSADAGIDAGTSFSDGGLDLNDVSWLLPLPSPAQHALLLSLSSEGSKGPLLPRALYDTLPGLVTTEDAAVLFPKFRVISIRIDPCFPIRAVPTSTPACNASGEQNCASGRNKPCRRPPWSGGPGH